MAFYLKIKSGSSLVDVSDYVTNISEVPYITRNADWTLLAEGYSFALSSNCTQSIALNYPVYFFSESLCLHNGYINKKNYDYANREYKIDVENTLLKLKEYNVESPGFSTYIDANDATININGKDGKLINATNILDACFDYAGIGINYNTTNEDYGNVEVIRGASWGYGQYTQYIGTSSADQLWFLPNQIYSINQDLCVIPATLAANESYKSKRISIFDLVSTLVAMKGWQIIPYTTSSFQAINNRTPYTVSESKVFYKEENFVKAKDGLKLIYSTQYLVPMEYNEPNNWIYWFGEVVAGEYSAVYYSTDLQDTTYFKEYADTVGTNYTDVPYYNNFNPIYLNWQPGIPTYFPWLIKANLTNQSLTKYYIEGLYSDKIEYKIETDLEILASARCAKRVSVDVMNRKTIYEYDVII